MNTVYETDAVNKEFLKLQGMNWIKSGGLDWREIEFEFNSKAFSIRQEINLEETNNAGDCVATLSTFYRRNSQWHRFGGPAVIQNESKPSPDPKCNVEWAIDGVSYSKNEFNFWMACQE